MASVPGPPKGGCVPFVVVSHRASVRQAHAEASFGAPSRRNRDWHTLRANFGPARALRLRVSCAALCDRPRIVKVPNTMLYTN
jgi:hypothetical protein